MNMLSTTDMSFVDYSVPRSDFRAWDAGHSKALFQSAETSLDSQKFEDTSNFSAEIIEYSNLFSLFQMATQICEGLNQSRLTQAFREAVLLSRAGLFPAYVEPEMSVDECGEFSFSISNEKGYLDIGVCGEGEISYHVRNDADPSKTAFGDQPFDRALPTELIEATIEFLE